MLKFILEATKTKLSTVSKQEEVKKSEYIFLQASNNDLHKVNMKSYNVPDMTEDSSTIPANHLRASTKQRKCENCKEMFSSKTVLEDHIIKTFGMGYS